MMFCLFGDFLLLLTSCSCCCLSNKTLRWSVYCPASLAAIDCVVGSWGPWSACTSPCGVGSKERSRQVSVPPRNGGTPCPDLKQRRGCFGNNAICSTAKGQNRTFTMCPQALMHAPTPALKAVTFQFGISVFSGVRLPLPPVLLEATHLHTSVPKPYLQLFCFKRLRFALYVESLYWG